MTVTPPRNHVWDALFSAGSDAIFRSVVEAAGEGMWIVTPEGRTLYANPRMLEMLGTTPDRLAARHALSFIPAADREESKQRFRRHLLEDEPSTEMRLQRDDGTMVWARLTSRLLRDGTGKIMGVLGMFVDATEQRLAAARLAYAEVQLRLAVDAAGLGTFNCQYPLAKLKWNDTCRSHFFLAPGEEPTLELFYERLHPDDREPVRRAIENSARQHATLDVEYRSVSPAGDQTKWIRAIGRHDYDAEGHPVRLDGVTIDVTDRKLLEQALRDESLMTQTLYALSKTLVTEFNDEKLIQQITDAGRLLTHAAFGAFFYNVAKPGGDTFLLYTLSGAERSTFDPFPVRPTTELFAPTFNGLGPIRSDDVTKDPRFGRNPPFHGMPMGNLTVRSYLAVPVVSRFGHVIGGLFYGHPEPGRFSERDERTLQAIALHAAIALDNARLLNDARQASAAKDQFLAVLSHELRTPLNPVLLTASMMAEDKALPEEVRKNADVIRRNVELEARLIDDMLDLTRIARGKLEIQPVNTDVHAQLRHVAGMFQNDARDKHVTLELDLKAERHHVKGDPARLHQVWWNLLGNALKFTCEKGSITIRSFNRPAEGASPDAGDMLVVEVIDTGIGIEPGQVDKLFIAFHQADETIGRRYGGLGLGLSISRSLVELHNGTLVASSPGRGKGATFTTTMPTVAPAARGDAAQQALPAGKPRPLSILLVEDHVDTARTMGQLLTAMGHRVTIAHTATAAIELAGNQPFDAFLCDLGLPDGSGLDVLRRIPPEQRCHAVALTGYGMDEDVKRSLEAGFAEHLTKPLDFERLTRILNRLAAAAGDTNLPDKGAQRPPP